MVIDMITENAKTLAELIKKYDALVKKRQIVYEESLNNKEKKHGEELNQINSKLEKMKDYVLALMTSLEKQIDSKL